MSSRSHSVSDQWRRRPPVIDHWRARRLSRRFADVGVSIPAARLRELSAGAPFRCNEAVDFNFALAATEVKREQRLARARRNRDRIVHGVIVTGLVLAALNLLICMGYAFITLALHESPF